VSVQGDDDVFYLFFEKQHLFVKGDERLESLDSFYKMKLDVMRNKSYLDVSRIL